MRPPWWFCCGWWSPWCVIDTVAHWLIPNPEDNPGEGLPGPFNWICDKHDAAILEEKQ